ncbi:LysR family transcriptional regulator [Nocardia fluminea]|uniref:DNA-binding transcriptional LysR family regulator n=1 Tax=Nocardia fluminea TaxID=134984 RepID=A0A2N3VL02_9NOCA|nr:LysR family transcriptional regulator [Nocardia fluminea]PKV82301.1 DNA-binding transcriptional LysR family regulator [Nocardia fluminea]
MSLPPGTPDLEVLDLLVSVAELGSLGAAARRHGISQPAVGMRISALERRLRLRLVDRGPTGSALTDAGAAVVELGRPVLAAGLALMDGVADLHRGLSPQLHVIASKTIADHRIPQWLAALRKLRPELAVELDVANSQQVTAAVRDREIVLGFVEGPQAPAGLGSRVLVADELVVVVAPTHPWANRTRPVSPRELADTPLVWREKGSGTRDTVWAALQIHGTPARPAAELGSAAAILATTRSGLAPAVVSRLIVAHELRAGTLYEVDLDDSLVLTRKFRAIWHRSTPPSGPAGDLVDLAARIEAARPTVRRSTGN